MQRAPTAAAATAACAALDATDYGQVRSAERSPGPPANDLVACRDPRGRLQVFVEDRHLGTLCTRNGMVAP